MAGSGALDADVVGILKRSYDKVNQARAAAQAAALQEFQAYAEHTTELDQDEVEG